MKKKLQDIKQQLKDLMHQSESLPEIKALLRLSDEIDNVLDILPDERTAGATSKNTTSRSKPAAKTGAKATPAAQPSAESPAATAKAPVTGKAKKKEPFIDPGDR